MQGLTQPKMMTKDEIFEVFTHRHLTHQSSTQQCVTVLGPHFPCKLRYVPNQYHGWSKCLRYAYEVTRFTDYMFNDAHKRGQVTPQCNMTLSSRQTLNETCTINSFDLHSNYKTWTSPSVPCGPSGDDSCNMFIIHSPFPVSSGQIFRLVWRHRLMVRHTISPYMSNYGTLSKHKIIYYAYYYYNYHYYLNIIIVIILSLIIIIMNHIHNNKHDNNTEDSAWSHCQLLSQCLE